MSSFSTEYPEQLCFPNEVVHQLQQIAEYKGKQALWLHGKADFLQSLKENAKIASVQSSNRMEQIEVDKKTLNDLVKKNRQPEYQDRKQTEIAGYRDALKIIHENAMDMKISTNTVRYIHKVLMSHTPNGGGEWKISANDVIEQDNLGNEILRLETVPPYLTQKSMEELHQGYQTQLRTKKIPSEIFIPIYVHEFLRIHPFNDGNGRTARLMMLVMLYQQGIDVGGYISLEKIIEHSKKSYYETLRIADQGWSDGTHDVWPFITYLLGVIHTAYRELQEKMDFQVPFGANTEMVKKTLMKLPREFSTSELHHLCPSVNKDTLRNIMQQLKQDGIIVSLGKGRAAKWQKSG